MEDHERAMTIKEVAKFLNISTQMVYNLMKGGKLHAFKIGAANRIMYSDVLAFVQQQKEEFARTLGENDDVDESMFVISQVSMQKGDFQLSDITFALPMGKIMTLLGPSGSGKTLLLKTIAGLEKMNNGMIFLGKTQLDLLAPASRKLGFVFENYALFPHMTAKRNIEFPWLLQKKVSSNIQRNMKKVIAEETNKRVQELNIDSSYLGRLPDQLPEGMKQLVAIARERNHELELFLMDEPMTKLDAAQHVQMRIFIRKIVRDLGKTTIITSNDPEDALVLSDYIGIMSEGKLLQFGETWEVYHRPVNLTVMEMTSRLAVNTARVEVSDGRTHPYNLQAELEDGPYDLAFRPEEIELSAEGIPAKITFSQFFDGTRKLAFCKIGADVDVKVMIPVELEETVTFVPIHPQFFRAERT
jgi:excisionase family DNA binding protein